MKGLQMFVATLILPFLVASAAPRSFAGQEGDPKAGKKTYGILCATCHGNSGKGDGPAAATLPTKPQNHTDGKYMNALTDKYVFDIIKGGGASVGKSPLMPPWGGQIDEQGIRNVVAYIRTLAKSSK